MPSFQLKPEDPTGKAEHVSAVDEHDALARFNHRLGLNLTFDDAGTLAPYLLVQIAEETSFKPAGTWGLFTPP
jgi:hypothetical protein